MNIRNIKNVDSIRFWIKEKIDKARTITSCKNEILKILEQHISNVIQLLSLFKKIELVAGEDLDEVTYIRYLISEALLKRK